MTFEVDAKLTDFDLTNSEYGPKLEFTVEGDTSVFEKAIDRCEWKGETFHRNLYGNRWEVNRTPTSVEAIERETGIEIPKSVLVPEEDVASFKIKRNSMFIEMTQVPSGVKEILKEDLSYEASYWDNSARKKRTYKKDVIFKEGIPIGLKSQVENLLDDLDITYSLVDYRKKPDLWNIDYEWNFPHDLRGYQKKGLSKMMQGSRVIQFPTGAGKTVTALRTVQQMGLSCLILVHQIDLLEQWKREIEQILGVTPGIVQGSTETYKNITVASIQTLSNRVEEKGDSYVIDDFDMMITDECLHPDVPIRMSDGSEKKISDIEIGEEVLSYNENKDIWEDKEVTRTYEEDFEGTWVEIEYSPEGKDWSREIKVTPDHEIWTKEDGWIEAQNLTVSHTVKNHLGDFMRCDDCGSKYDTSQALGGHTVTAHNPELQSEKSKKRWENKTKEERIQWMNDNLIEPREENGWLESMEKMGKDRKGDDNPLFYNMSREEAKKHLSEKQIEWWESLPEEERKERVKTWIEAPKHRTDGDPSSLEQWVIDLGHTNLEFTGKSDFWVEDEKGPMNPDFKVKGERKVIEVGDTNHWHNEKDIQERIERLNSIGYECLYIRDTEIEYSPSDVKCRIDSFVNNHEASIVSVEEVSGESDYSYDLEVEDNHNFVANDLLVHNCHHLPADTWLDVALHINAYYRYGLSATVEEGLHVDGEGIKIVAGIGPNDVKVSPEYLIREGYLAKPKFEWLYPKKVGRGFDNWQEAYKKGIVQNSDRNMIIVEKAEELLNEDRRILVDVKRIEHGERILGKFEDGLVREYWDPNEIDQEDLRYDVTFDPNMCANWPIPVVHDGEETKGYSVGGDMMDAVKMAVENTDRSVIWVSGEDSSELREWILQKFRQGEIDIVVSTLLREGVDVPELDAVLLAGGGKSAIQLIQTIGRALRPKGSQDAIVVDCKDVGSYVGSHAKSRYKSMNSYYGEFCNTGPIGF